jgi:hypothetical protein
MKQIYNRVGVNQTTGIYFDNDTQEKILVVRVNRDYGTKKKKPIYYLKKGRKNQKPQYLTGLFATDNPQEFSGDMKDPVTGMKNMLKVSFLDGGENLEIEGVRLWER